MRDLRGKMIGDITRTLTDKLRVEHGEMFELVQHWPALTGRLASETRPSRVDQGQLRVACTSSAVACEFQHEIPRIASAIADLLPHTGIESIRCFVSTSD